MQNSSSTIHQRITELIKAKNLTPATFAREIGITEPAVKNYIEDRIPQSEIIIKILAKYEEIDPDWFLHGIGKMYRGRYSGIPLDKIIQDAEESNIPYTPIGLPPFSSFPEIRKRIQDLMKWKQYSLSMLNKQTKIRETILNAQIYGKSPITIDVIETVSAVFNVSYNWLLTGYPETHSDRLFIQELLDKIVEVSKDNGKKEREIKLLKQEKEQLQAKTNKPLPE